MKPQADFKMIKVEAPLHEAFKQEKKKTGISLLRLASLIYTGKHKPLTKLTTNGRKK